MVYRIRVSRCPLSHSPSQCLHTVCIITIYMVLGLDKEREIFYGVLMVMGIHIDIYIYGACFVL